MYRASMPAINDKTVATGAKPRSVDWLINRDALRHARGDVTMLTNVFTGRPARALANRLAIEVGPLTDASPDFPLPMGGLAPFNFAEQATSNLVATTTLRLEASTHGPPKAALE
jgi:hypothetical protein